MTASPSSDQPQTAWARFERLSRSSPHLNQDPLYALPVRLIDIISESLPGFWSQADLRFERRLARESGHGFFRHEAFLHPLLDEDAVPRSGIHQQQEWQRRDAQLQDLLDGEMRRFGKPNTAIERHRKRSQLIHQRCRQCVRGYLGWLVTDPEFRRSYQAFAADWSNRIWNDGTFPSIPMSFFGERPPPVPKRDRGFVAQARLFLQLWSLQTMVTPELPLPILPQLVGPTVYDPAWLGEAGLSVHVPNYLFRERSFSLADLANLNESFGHLGHLRGWLQERPRGWGNERFGRMLDLYVYWELALGQRYPDRIDGNMTALDRAFATYWRRGNTRRRSRGAEESARRIRQKLRRLMRDTVRS